MMRIQNKSRFNKGYDGLDDENERTFLPPNGLTNSSYLTTD